MKKLELTLEFLKECLQPRSYKYLVDDVNMYGSIEDYLSSIFSFDSDEGRCDCATRCFDSFRIFWSCVKPKMRQVLFSLYVLSQTERGLTTFSDSKRNNQIYKYMDGLKEYGFTIIEYPTSDGKSTIKRALYIKK